MTKIDVHIHPNAVCMNLRFFLNWSSRISYVNQLNLMNEIEYGKYLSNKWIGAKVYNESKCARNSGKIASVPYDWSAICKMSIDRVSNQDALLLIRLILDLIVS